MKAECDNCGEKEFCDWLYPAGYDVSGECKRYRPREEYVKLPFSVGQCIWFLKRTKGGKRVLAYVEVRRYIFTANGLYLKLGCDLNREFPISHIGKYIFESRREAQKMLDCKQGTEI